MINLIADDIEVQFIIENSISFQHQTGAKGDFHLPEAIGAGLAWIDYDNLTFNLLKHFKGNIILSIGNYEEGNSKQVINPAAPAPITTTSQSVK